MPSGDFAAYTAAAEAAIAGADRARERPLAPEVISDRAPFELTPDPRRCPGSADGPYLKAALLLHDLGGTPYEMQDLGRALSRACYLVRAILLPGHGTVPGDLLAVDYREWTEATRLAVASFEGRAESLVLVGFGVGATLALREALLGPSAPGPELVGLVLLAPELAAAAPAWLPAARLSGDVLPAGRWSRLQADRDPVRYESLPRNAERQRADLIAELGPEGEPLQLPVYGAISAVDAEVDTGTVRDWFCRAGSGPRRLLWFGSEPVAGAGWCPVVVAHPSSGGADILDLSHVALPIAPGNPRYGKDATYVDCAHYYWEAATPSWFVCMDPATTAAEVELRRGEITEANLQRYVVRRLTYNPDFEAMARDLLAFLADPPQPQAADDEERG